MVVLTAGFILQSITIKKHISLMQKVEFRGFSCISATYYSYVSVCVRVLLVCISVCSPFVSVRYPYVVRLLLPVCFPYLSVCCPCVSVCYPMLSVRYPYVVRMYRYVTRMLSVCFPYIVRMLLVCTQCMLPVCARVSQLEKTLKKGNHILNTASVKKATL